MEIRALIARRTRPPVNSVPPFALFQIPSIDPHLVFVRSIFSRQQQRRGAEWVVRAGPRTRRKREARHGGEEKDREEEVPRSPLPPRPMHACFHGGGGTSRVTKSVGIIAKSMKALSFMKVRAAGGGDQPWRRRPRHPHRSPKAEEPPDKDVAAASASASASAKIAPHEADGDREDPLRTREEQEQGGAMHERCDKCCSPLEEEDGAGAGAGDGEAAADSDREWAAEPEPGVLMTLVSRGDGTNHLRRIRFSEEYFGDAWAAQNWWADNCDRIVELYSVVVQSEHPSHGDEDDDDPAAPVTPCQSEDDDHQPPPDGIGELEYSASCSASASASGGSTSNFSGPSSGSGSGSANKVDSPILGLVTEAESFATAAKAKRSHTTRERQ